MAFDKYTAIFLVVTFILAKIKPGWFGRHVAFGPFERLTLGNRVTGMPALA